MNSCPAGWLQEPPAQRRSHQKPHVHQQRSKRCVTAWSGCEAHTPAGVQLGVSVQHGLQGCTTQAAAPAHVDMVQRRQVPSNGMHGGVCQSAAAVQPQVLEVGAAPGNCLNSFIGDLWADKAGRLLSRSGWRGALSAPRLFQSGTWHGCLLAA